MTCEVVVITWLSTDEVSWFGFWEKKAPMISWATKSGSQYEYTWIISGIREELLIRWSERYHFKKVTQKTPPLIRIKPLQYILKFVKIKPFEIQKTDLWIDLIPKASKGVIHIKIIWSNQFQVKRLIFTITSLPLEIHFLKSVDFNWKTKIRVGFGGDISQMNRGTYIRNK